MLNIRTNFIELVSNKFYYQLILIYGIILFQRPINRLIDYNISISHFYN